MNNKRKQKLSILGQSRKLHFYKVARKYEKVGFQKRCYKVRVVNSNRK